MRKWVLYFIYIWAATFFFLYFLFPADAVKDLLAAQIQKAYPDYGITVDRVRPAFPPGLQFKKVGLSHKDHLWAEAEHIKVIPNYLSIFSPQKTIDFRGRLYMGDIVGSVGIRKVKDAYQYSAKATVTDIRVEEIQRLQEVSGRKISGILDAVFQMNTVKGTEKEIVIRLNLTNCAIELTNPLINMNIEYLLFRNIDAELAIGKQSLQLKKCRATGRQIDGNLAGTILFRDPIGKSILNLRGNIKPHHTVLASVKKILPGNLLQTKGIGDSGFPIKLYGTIEKSKFSLK
jgi:type II secretion system protein N